MTKTYDELLKEAKQLERDYKFTKAFEVYKEAKELDDKNPKAYIEAAKAAYVTKQYSESVVLHIIGVLLSMMKKKVDTVNKEYSRNAEHIANCLLIQEESLQKQVMDFLDLNKEQLEYATDAYKYSLLGSSGRSSYDTFIELLTSEIYTDFQDIMITLGLKYINNLLESYPSKEAIISHFSKNLSW